jgi:hypothetical protein
VFVRALSLIMLALSGDVLGDFFSFAQRLVVEPTGNDNLFKNDYV